MSHAEHNLREWTAKANRANYRTEEVIQITYPACSPQPQLGKTNIEGSSRISNQSPLITIMTKGFSTAKTQRSDGEHMLVDTIISYPPANWS